MRRHVRVALWILAVLFAGLGVPEAGFGAPGVPEDVAAWWSEDDEEARGAHALKLAWGGANAADVYTALRAGRTYTDKAPKRTVHTWKRPTADGVEHTCYLLVPPAYDPAQPTRLLVWLHGGVARDEDLGGVSGIRLYGEKAAEEGFLLLAPSAQRGSEWWTPEGVALVQGAIADVRRRYHVDAQRIACAGFSDGASGCFHLLAHAPEPFCCFLALMGQPLVSRLAGGPTFAANVASRPCYAVSGGTDPLYPSARIAPLVEELRGHGADIEWKDLADVGHDWNALPALWPELKAFWEAHPLATRETVRWQSASPRRTGRCDWVEILEVDPHAPQAEGFVGESLPIPAPTARPRLGVSLDSDFAGPGLRIEDIEDGSAAAAGGVRAGDVLIEVEGSALAGAQDFAVLRDALDTLQREERDGTFVFLRDGERLEIALRPRIVAADLKQAEPTGPDIGKPSGLVEAKRLGPNRLEVRTHNVGRLRLHLGPDLVDFSAPIVVVLNGVVRHETRIEPSVPYVLTEAWRDGGVPRHMAWLDLAP